MALTSDGLRLLAQAHSPRESEAEPKRFRVHQLSQRLGTEKVNEIVDRYTTGESATALAKEYDVAPSALLRLIRERNVVVRTNRVSPDLTATLVAEHEAGTSMAKLEAKYRLSHGAVFRALHRVDASSGRASSSS